MRGQPDPYIVKNIPEFLRVVDTCTKEWFVKETTWARGFEVKAMRTGLSNPRYTVPTRAVTYGL